MSRFFFPWGDQGVVTLLTIELTNASHDSEDISGSIKIKFLRLLFNQGIVAEIITRNIERESISTLWDHPNVYDDSDSLPDPKDMGCEARTSVDTNPSPVGKKCIYRNSTLLLFDGVSLIG